MKYVKRNGKQIPALGFGTWKILGNQAVQKIRNALNIGYRLIDTAQIYRNEALVGKAISKSNIPRDHLFIVTKLWATNLSYQRVLKSVEQSLQRLKADYLDLLLIHRPNSNIPLQETLQAMAHLQKQGKIKHIGVSNFPLSLLQRARSRSPLPILVDQVPYHPFISQKDLLEYCQNHDIILMAYSPLAQGKVLENSVLKKIGKRHGKSAVQVTLRWLLQQDNVIAIPKAANPIHQRANYEVFDFRLSRKEMEVINTLAQQYPSPDNMWKLTQAIHQLPVNVAQRVDSLFITLSTTLAPLWTTPN